MKTDLYQHNKDMDLTHGPDSTITDPTFSSPFSVTSLHSAENSALQPWKFSNSNSTTWMTHGAGSQEEEEGGGDSNLQHHLQSRHFQGTLYVAPAPPWLFPAASCSGALCCSDILLIHRSSTLWQQHTHRQSTIHQACTGGAQTDAHRRRKLSVTVQFQSHP